MRVWLAVPPAGGKQLLAVRRSIEQECRARGWKLDVRTTTASIDGVPVVQPDDAVALYSRIHREPVSVLSVQAPHAPGPVAVARPPGRVLRVAGREVVSLRELCRHKALFSRLRWDRPPGGWASRFARWASTQACDGHHDPRCLPLYVFETQTWSRSLLRPNGRAAFDGQYGGGAERTDERRRTWKTGPAHGRTVLTIAGTELPRGFHWDVNAPGSPVELWTMSGDWIIDQYLNVTPDASVRTMPKYARAIPLATATKKPRH